MGVFLQSDFAWTSRQFIGGAVALDLSNTSVYHRWPERRSDRLVQRSDLERWWEAAARFSAEVGLPLAGSPSTSLSDIDFHETLLLRELARSIFSAAAEGMNVDRQAIGTLFSLSGRLLRESSIRDGAFCLPSDRTHPISSLVCASIVGLLWRGPLDRVRACPGCDFLFLDRSRNRTRKWCDMEICGNRAKAERLAQRRAHMP